MAIGDNAAQRWSTLDEPWQEAFRQAWEALRTGNIPVGACASTPDGEIVHSARNRVNDAGGPRGEIFGSSLAHAEQVLRNLGEGTMAALVHELENGGEVQLLTAMEADAALGYLWGRLPGLTSHRDV